MEAACLGKASERTYFFAHMLRYARSCAYLSQGMFGSLVTVTKSLPR